MCGCGCGGDFRFDGTKTVPNGTNVTLLWDTIYKTIRTVSPSTMISSCKYLYCCSLGPRISNPVRLRWPRHRVRGPRTCSADHRLSAMMTTGRTVGPTHSCFPRASSLPRRPRRRLRPRRRGHALHQRRPATKLYRLGQLFWGRRGRAVLPSDRDARDHHPGRSRRQHRRTAHREHVQTPPPCMRTRTCAPGFSPSRRMGCASVVLL